jgi:hypothetical protein
MVQGEGSVNSSAVGSEALAAVLRERTNSLPVPTGAPKSRNDTSLRSGNHLHACLSHRNRARVYDARRLWTLLAT